MVIGTALCFHPSLKIILSQSQKSRKYLLHKRLLNAILYFFFIFGLVRAKMVGFTALGVLLLVIRPRIKAESNLKGSWAIKYIIFWVKSCEYSRAITFGNSILFQSIAIAMNEKQTIWRIYYFLDVLHIRIATKSTLSKPITIASMTKIYLNVL